MQPDKDIMLCVKKEKIGYTVESNLSSPLDYLRILDLVFRDADGASAICSMMVRVLACMSPLDASNMMASIMEQSDLMRQNLVEDDDE